MYLVIFQVFLLHPNKFTRGPYLNNSFIWYFSDVTSNEVIGTHFLDLNEISNEGQKNKGGIKNGLLFLSIYMCIIVIYFS